MTTSRTLAFAATLAVSFAPAGAHAADWYAPQQPFAIYGDTYYVGTHGISAVLIASKAGHILVDVGGPEAARQVEDHIRQLGFRVEDIRIILNSHAHQDHAGAIAALQQASSAQVLAGPGNVPVLGSGQPDRSDPQYPGLTPMVPIARTRALRDGEVIRVGPLAVTAHFTPGHTKGGVSYTWQSREAGRTVDLVFADSVFALAADGRSFSANPLYPNARADVEHSIAAIASLKCDVLISAHPEFSGLWERKAKAATLGHAAFIDPNACRAYADTGRAFLAETLAKEKATAQPESGHR
jgi:metallo-beta-lactamase class B